MTEDQIEKLASMGANMVHVMSALDELKAGMRGLPTKEDLREFVTRTEHSSEVRTLTERVGRLEDQVKEQSPKSLMTKLRDIALTITLTVAAVGALSKAFGLWK